VPEPLLTKAGELYIKVGEETVNVISFLPGKDLGTVE
jgi:hypothetical protein